MILCYWFEFIKRRYRQVTQKYLKRNLEQAGYAIEIVRAGSAISLHEPAACFPDNTGSRLRTR
jgi:hypothetical protein